MVIMGQKQKIIAFILFVLGLISLLRTLILLWNSYLPDFDVYYRSTILAFNGGNPYNNTEFSMNFIYPPQSLLILFPISLLTFPLASKVWVILSILFSLGALLILYKLIPANNFIKSIVFLGYMISFPYKFTLGMGQINNLVLFLICISLYFLIKNNDFYSSIGLTFAIILKAFPILYFYGLIYKKWKVIILTTLFIASLYIASLFIIKSEIINSYITQVLPSLLGNSPGGIYYNQSLTSFFSRLDIPAFFLLPIRLFFIFTSFYMILKKKHDLIFSFAVITTLILIVNSFSWQHHFVLLLIPFYYLITSRINKWNILFLSLSYILVSFNINNPEQIKSLWLSILVLSHVFFGTLILWFLLLYGKK